MVSMLRSSSVLFLVFIYLTSTASAQTTRNVGASETYTTIAAAIAAASSGDIINIVDSIHTEHSIVINKNLTIQGQGALATIVQASTIMNMGAGRVFNVSGGVTVVIKNLTVRFGDVTGEGGGIDIPSGNTVSIEASRFRHNRASTKGGAIRNGGTLNMTDCTVDNNSNSSLYGGGFYLSAGLTTLTNCTVSDNTSTLDGGGFEVGGELILNNCTIANNVSGGYGGGVYVSHFVRMRNTIISGNTPSNCSDLIETSYGYNIESGTDCGCTGTGDQRNTNPLLSTLGFYGGPTPTLALQSGSPAIDPLISNGAPTYDQRGATRVGTADIGSYEFDGDLLPVELTSFQARVRNGSVQLTWHTATEINNYGFDVQRMSNGTWEAIAFVVGHGTTNSPKRYSFTDLQAEQGAIILYRLKQIDRDGAYEYSGVVEAHTGATPMAASLRGNYPNPFAGQTAVSYIIPAATDVSLRVYDVRGMLVKELVNAMQSEGSYSVPFNAGSIPAGLYILELRTPAGTQVAKMTVAR